MKSKIIHDPKKVVQNIESSDYANFKSAIARINDPVTVRTDAGKNEFVLKIEGLHDKVYYVSQRHMLDIVSLLPEGSAIKGEKAHLGVHKNSVSLAAPFTAEEILKFNQTAALRGIKIELESQYKTTKAKDYLCKKTGIKYGKSDKVDVIASELWDQDRQNSTSEAPAESIEEITEISKEREESHKWVKMTSVLANLERNQDYTGSFSKWVDQEYDYLADNASDSTRDFFGIQENPKGGWKRTKTLKNAVDKYLINILVTMMDHEGNLRTRLVDDRQEIPHWKWAKKNVFRMSPFHHRGGVVRSNFYHHKMKSYIKNKSAEDGIPLDFHVTYFDGEIITEDQYLELLETKQVRPEKPGSISTKDPRISRTVLKVGQMSKEEDASFRKYRTIACNSIREMYRIIRQRLMEQNNLND